MAHLELRVVPSRPLGDGGAVPGEASNLLGSLCWKDIPGFTNTRTDLLEM